jgi:hypothetical protein
MNTCPWNDSGDFNHWERVRTTQDRVSSSDNPSGTGKAVANKCAGRLSRKPYRNHANVAIESNPCLIQRGKASSAEGKTCAGAGVGCSDGSSAQASSTIASRPPARTARSAQVLKMKVRVRGMGCEPEEREEGIAWTSNPERRLASSTRRRPLSQSEKIFADSSQASSHPAGTGRSGSVR